MGNFDELKKRLASLDGGDRNKLLNSLTSSLNTAQQQKLMSLIQDSSSSELEQMISEFTKGSGSADTLLNSIDSEQTKQKLRDILG